MAAATPRVGFPVALARVDEVREPTLRRVAGRLAPGRRRVADGSGERGPARRRGRAARPAGAGPPARRRRRAPRHRRGGGAHIRRLHAPAAGGRHGELAPRAGVAAVTTGGAGDPNVTFVFRL